MKLDHVSFLKSMKTVKRDLQMGLQKRENIKMRCVGIDKKRNDSLGYLASFTEHTHLLKTYLII